MSGTHANWPSEWSRDGDGCALDCLCPETQCNPEAGTPPVWTRRLALGRSSRRRRAGPLASRKSPCRARKSPEPGTFQETGKSKGKEQPDSDPSRGVFGGGPLSRSSATGFWVTVGIRSSEEGVKIGRVWESLGLGARAPVLQLLRIADVSCHPGMVYGFRSGRPDSRKP